MEHTQKNTEQISKEQFVDILHNALCNGLYYFSSYGLYLDYHEDDYKIAKEELKKENNLHTICIEDVWLKMLQMKLPFNIIDEECEGEYNAVLDLDEMYSNLQFVQNDNLQNIIFGDDDAVDCDAFLQGVIYKEIIFC
jgi:hypothetical protein